MANTVSIVFGAITATNQESYLRQRISLLSQASNALFNGNNRLPLSNNELDNEVEIVTFGLKSLSTPPLAPVVDLSSLTSNQSEDIRKRKVCMQNDITKLFPLLDGENVEKDEVSFLTKEWQGFPNKASVLKRKTNLSLTYYIHSDIIADPENQMLIDKNFISEVSLIEGQVALVKANFGEAAKTLASGMTGLLPPPLNVLGATLISAFWPSSNDATAQWQQVYDSLQTIVRNALARNNVTLASQRLAGFVNFLDTEYKGLKNTPSTTKQQLSDSLTPFDVAFFLDIVNIFMYTEQDKGLAAASLANFMTGACTHLALNQERALVDPNASTPSESAFAKTVSNLAKVYSTYARTAAPYVRELRLNQISSVKSDSRSTCSRAGCNTTYFFFFTDSNTGFRSPDFSYNSGQKDPPNVEGDAKRALERYRTDITNEINNTLQSQVFDVVDSWGKLIENPIPTIK